MDARELAEARETATGKLIAALREAAQQQMALIIADLIELLPQRERECDEAKERLAEAEFALAGPQERVTLVKAELAECAGCIAECEHNFDADDMETRVSARKWHREYVDEHARITARVASAEGDLQPLYAVRNEAQTLYDGARVLVASMQAAMLDPFNHPLGQAVPAYMSARQLSGMLVPVLASGDRDHPEWGRGIMLLKFLCLRSGYRTEDDDWLPDGNWRLPEWYPDAYTQDPPPAPSAREAMAADVLPLANRALNRG